MPEIKHEKKYKNLGFTQVANVVVRDGEIEPKHKALYLLLLSYAFGGQSCHPSQSRMAEELGVTKRTIRSWAQELENLNLLKIKRRKAPSGGNLTNAYIIRSPENRYTDPGKLVSGGPPNEVSGGVQNEASAEEYKAFKNKNIEEDNNNAGARTQNKSISAHESILNIQECLTEKEQVYLEKISNVAGYPFDIEKDLEYFRELKEDFPEVDAACEIKKWAAYKLDNPLKENSNPRLQIRNWFENAASGRYANNRGVNRKVADF